MCAKPIRRNKHKLFFVPVWHYMCPRFAYVSSSVWMYGILVIVAMQCHTQIEFNHCYCLTYSTQLYFSWAVAVWNTALKLHLLRTYSTFSLWKHEWCQQRAPNKEKEAVAFYSLAPTHTNSVSMWAFMRTNFAIFSSIWKCLWLIMLVEKKG